MMPSEKLRSAKARSWMIGWTMPRTNMVPTQTQIAVGRAADAGATLIVDGRDLAVEGDGYFLGPTLVDHVTADMEIYQQEVFGPVLAITTVKDDQEAIRVANNTDYGLAAGLWTANVSKVHRLSRQIRAGTVWVNCYNIFDAALPFGGYKQSGWGREMGEEALQLYTETKAVCLRL